MTLDDDDAPLDARGFRILVGFVTLGAVLSAAAVIATRRFLYADASYFLLNMWESGSFFVPNRSRWVGFVTSQWIPVTAMKLGWRDPGGIATLFGINLWMNPFLSVMIAWWVSGRSREVTLAVLFCELLLFQTTYVVIDNESSVFFWLAALLFILTLRRDFSFWALLLLVPILFTHGVAVLAFAPVLAMLLAWRRGYLEYYGPTRFWSLVAAIALLVALVALRVASPSAGQNRTFFIEGALSLPGSPAVVLSAFAFGSLWWHAFRPKPAWLTGVFWASTGMLLLLPFALPEVVWPFFHYRARVLNAVLALLLFAYLHARVLRHLSPPSRLPSSRVLALVLVLFVFQGKVTWEWHRHMTLFRAELEGARGIAEFPREGPFSEARSRQFSWSWTSPVRSIVFQAMDGGRVDAIMLNADTTLWQPFHPRVPSELPDLSAFGVRYAPELTDPVRRSSPTDIVRPSGSTYWATRTPKTSFGS